MRMKELSFLQEHTAGETKIQSVRSLKINQQPLNMCTSDKDNNLKRVET